MTEQQTDRLYRDITRITEEYLGPAAERFVGRQISGHLDKQPQELTRDDLPKLIEWSRVTLGLLTDDHDMVDQYTHKLEQLYLAGK